MQSYKTRLLSINMYSIHTRSMETRYHRHHGHYIPHRGGEGVLNTANGKANDRTLMQFMPLSPSILGVCRRSKYSRWRDTIDEDDTWIWGLDSMIKPSAAPDYIYHAAMVRNLRWWLAVGVFFHFDTTTFQFRPKKYFFECESAPSTQDCVCDDPTVVTLTNTKTWITRSYPSQF